MIETIEELANKIGVLVVDAVKKQFLLQGHKLTGKLIDSIEQQVQVRVSGARIQVLAESYAKFVNNGVAAANIPFGGGRGGTSKYIQGLKNFARLRFGVTDKEALSIAFAIAKKHKREGMPTRSSVRFSKTGKRTEAIEDALAEVDDELNKLIEDTLEVIVNLSIEQKI